MNYLFTRYGENEPIDLGDIEEELQDKFFYKGSRDEWFKAQIIEIIVFGLDEWEKDIEIQKALSYLENNYWEEFNDWFCNQRIIRGIISKYETSNLDQYIDCCNLIRSYTCKECGNKEQKDNSERNLS